ncbi:MAG: hybrid sensor histidine kinase/response regulator, partial [Sphingobacteriales bacterium]
GNIVHEICKDKYGNLWVGTEDAGLNQINLKTGHITHFLPSKNPGSLAYHNIHGLVADDDKLWIGTYEHGLDLMDLKTHKVIRHYSANTGKGSLSSDFIVTLYKSNKGDILVGTWTGLFKYNRANNNFDALPFTNIPIQSIKEDSNGTLWISSYGGGVYHYNEATGHKEHFTYEPGKTNGLINNYVNSVFTDSRKNWWFCTEGGISNYNPSTGKFTNYTTANGLPDNQAFRILEDKVGLLWISTAKGLARFNPTSQQFEVYHTVNGLPTDQFNYNSSYLDTDGTMYFGTVKGMVSFNPAAFIKNSFVPPVYITGLQVNNRDIPVGKGSTLAQSIIYTKNITLPHDSANLSLDVAALSYIIPEMNGYRYKMEGIDKNWIQLKNNRKIYYT